MARVAVVVPTLVAGQALEECLASLARQTLPVEIIVVDNSGKGLARRSAASRLIENRENAGFGAAVNQGWNSTGAEFLAVLNDDAVADAGWAEALVRAAEAHPEAGAFASRIELDVDRLDSAGMLLYGDGTAKQRGHGEPPSRFARDEEVLLASGCAAMYRRTAIEETGAFEGDFFLYGEDTDLGLRLQWAGWKCRYVARARVRHRYSHSAGRASALKAYYVERNRIAVAVRTFPLRMLWKAPLWNVVRMGAHLVALLRGEGAAGAFGGGGMGHLAWLLLKARLSAWMWLGRLVGGRRRILASRRIEAREFARLARRHRIGAWQLARQ